MKIELSFDAASEVTICTLLDSLGYIKKEQEWFEANEEQRDQLEDEWGHGMYVHPDDYEINKALIQAITTVLHYYGETDE